MELWLDTTNTNVIQKAIKLGFLSGITTNPAIVADSNHSMEEVLDELMVCQEGPIAVQVNASTVSDMVQQGQNLYSISTRIIVKVPITKEGLEAIHLLSRQGIPTMATVVFYPHQALTAALAGANYVAPYLTKIENSGGDPWMLIKTTQQFFQNYRLKTKILGASISTVDQIIQCAAAGIYGVTLKATVFEEFVGDQPLTVEAVNVFSEVFNASKQLLKR